MSAPTRERAPIGNRLLAALQRGKDEQFLARLTPITLAAGEVLSELGAPVQQAYFLNNSVASLLSISEEGGVIAVGMVGNEGMIGVPLILGADKVAHRVVVQFSGQALMVKAEVLKDEFKRGGRLEKLLLGYADLLLTQFALAGACNRFHTVEQRLCRWLLATNDRVQSDNLQLTQEFIAQMLGVSRPSVTLAASRLQKLNLLSYRRGRITLLERRGLELAACSCYRILKQELEQFLSIEG